MMRPYLVGSVGSVIALDRSGRRAPGLFRRSCFHGAVKALREASRVAVVTGFLIPEAMAPETDGPPGAACLARAIVAEGREAVILTDGSCADAVSATLGALGAVGTVLSPCDGGGGLPSPREFDLILFVERIGRSSDGSYRNMRGRDVSRWVAPLDQMALDALEDPQGPWVVAIGDGGNEAGMGNLRECLSAELPDFAGCLSVVESHFPLAVDVSNWGAYALAGAAFGPWAVPSPLEELRMLDAMLDLGAVDGALLERRRSVDGFGVQDLEAVLTAIRGLF